jgi:hypothetical protein
MFLKTNHLSIFTYNYIPPPISRSAKSEEWTCFGRSYTTVGLLLRARMPFLLADRAELRNDVDFQLLKRVDHPHYV